MARITLYKQSDSMQCGIACLQMICKYHGRDVNHTFLSEMCCATHEGVSLLGINNVATDIGFKTVSGRISVDAIGNGELPCILHWNQNHFVVLYKVKKGKKFYIADPGKGLVKYDLEEFKRHWISTKSEGKEKNGLPRLYPRAAPTRSDAGKTMHGK